MPDWKFLRHAVWIVPVLALCLVFWWWRNSEPKSVPQVPEFSEDVKRAWQPHAARMGWVQGWSEKFATFVWIFEEDRKWARGSWVLPAIELKSCDADVLAALPGPSRPFALVLSASRVTKRCLEALRRFSTLEALRIGPGDVQPGALAVLAELPNLRHLSLWRTNITDAEGRHLARCTGLRSLDLHETRVGNGTVRALTALPKLIELRLDGTRVTDSACSDLARMTELRRLSLDRTAVSDACLDRLKNARNLDHLSLFETRVSGERLDAFRAEHPECEVCGPRSGLPSP